MEKDVVSLLQADRGCGDDGKFQTMNRVGAQHVPEAFETGGDCDEDDSIEVDSGPEDNCIDTQSRKERPQSSPAR